MNDSSAGRPIQSPAALPTAALVVGALALFSMASFPWLVIVVALVGIVLAGLARKQAHDQLDKAMVCIGATLSIAALVLCWATPGIFSIIWGN